MEGVKLSIILFLYISSFHALKLHSCEALRKSTGYNKPSQYDNHVSFMTEISRVRCKFELYQLSFVFTSEQHTKNDRALTRRLCVSFLLLMDSARGFNLPMGIWSNDTLPISILLIKDWAYNTWLQYLLGSLLKCYT